MNNDLISRSMLVGEEGLFTKRGCPGKCGCCSLWTKDGCGVILEAPAVEARPAIHAKWEWVDDEECGIYRCSHCGCAEGHPRSFCPDCGAIMKLESEGTDE